MKTKPESTAQTTQDLLDELRTLVLEAEKMMGESLSEGTTDAVTSLRERFDAAQERLGTFYNGAKKKVIAGAQCTDEAIRANPYQAIAITAGVALLAGILLGRRTR